MFNTGFLFASLIWGSVGGGYWIWGKKASSMSSMVGGALMIAVSCFVPNVWFMSIISVLLMAAVYWTVRRGY